MNRPSNLRSRLRSTAFAFRGYNVKNLGRTPELLEHHAYGPLVESYLRQGSVIASETLKRPVDLSARVKDRIDTSGLGSYAEDVALVVSTELAQLRLMEEFHGVTVARARYTTGYSLGEISALVASAVYDMDVIQVPIALSDDCVELANNVTMGIFFSRGSALDFQTINRLCLELSSDGDGVVAPSTYLSPNSVIVLGQNGMLGRMEARIRDEFKERIFLRRNPHKWPPLHTPLTWQKSIPNRSAEMMQTMRGGFRTPEPPVVSMVTGKTSYQAYNSRDLLHRWVDQPQRLWDVVYKVLADGIDTVVHVGPAPNLIPATFRRLAENVRAQTQGKTWVSFGRRAVSAMAQRPWLTGLLPEQSALFRAQFLEHIMLEDWLLEQRVP